MAGSVERRVNKRPNPYRYLPFGGISAEFAPLSSSHLLPAMKHYDFAQRFRALYDKAVGLYAKGQRNADKLCTPDELAFLSANGITAQHLFDYAEDHHNYGAPGPDNALAIECVRRDYFLNVQGSRALAVLLDESTLPPKTDTIRGIAWLPRLLPKTRAKLRGELPVSLMYCCGGDRAFFEKHDILPSEFLAIIWRLGDDDGAIIDWVARRSAARS